MLLEPLAEFWVFFSYNFYGDRLFSDGKCPNRGTIASLDRGRLILLYRHLGYASLT